MRTAVRNLKISTQKEKKAIRAKNQIKIKHLEKKFTKKKEEGVPASLARYAEIFQKSSDYKPVERDKVVRIGNIPRFQR